MIASSVPGWEKNNIFLWTQSHFKRTQLLICHPELFPKRFGLQHHGQGYSQALSSGPWRVTLAAEANHGKAPTRHGLQTIMNPTSRCFDRLTRGLTPASSALLRPIYTERAVEKQANLITSHQVNNLKIPPRMLPWSTFSFSCSESPS